MDREQLNAALPQRDATEEGAAAAFDAVAAAAADPTEADADLRETPALPETPVQAQEDAQTTQTAGPYTQTGAPAPVFPIPPGNADRLPPFAGQAWRNAPREWEAAGQAEPPAEPPAVFAGKKKKDPQRRRFVIFAAVLVAVCIVCSAVTGAASSFLVLKLASVFSASEYTTEENTYVPDFSESAAPSLVADEAQAETNANAGQETASAASAATGAAQTAAPPAAAAQKSGKTKGEIYASAVNSIVSVEAKGRRTVQSMFGFGTTQTVTSRGSGFFYTADGYIVTNYHVVEDMDSYTVTTYDGAEYSVSLRGYDAANDIAVLKAEGSFTPVTLGASATLQVGDDVLVIGNALGELSYTFTDGVVSYLSRVVTGENGRAIRMFQTNAAINEGNSGGPVYDMNGEVVGIASAKYASETIEGLGFCIPIDDVKSKISDIVSGGYVTDNPLLGISVQTVTEGLSMRYNVPVGCYIVICEEGSAAARAGLLAGDVLVKADGRSLSACEDLGAVLATKKAGQTLELTAYRNGAEQNVTVTLDVSRNAPARTNYSNVFDY